MKAFHSLYLLIIFINSASSKSIFQIKGTASEPHSVALMKKPHAVLANRTSTQLSSSNSKDNSIKTKKETNIMSSTATLHPPKQIVINRIVEALQERKLKNIKSGKYGDTRTVQRYGLNLKSREKKAEKNESKFTVVGKPLFSKAKKKTLKVHLTTLPNFNIEEGEEEDETSDENESEDESYKYEDNSNDD